MKRSVLILTFPLALLMPFLVLAAPGIPHQFYGLVNYSDGSAVLSGAVNAKINGAVVVSGLIANGQYGYNPNLFFVTDPDNDRVGKTILFFVNDIDTGKSAVFANGGYTKIDLSIAAIAPLTPTLTPSGDGINAGGGSYTTTSTTPATAKVGDITGDNIINEYDFAMLMADWGKTGSSPADLNHDGVVNEYDFAIMMANWGS